MHNQAEVMSEFLEPSTSKSKAKPARLPAVDEFSWIWVGLILLFVCSSIVAPGTMTRGSILAMLPFAGILAIVATGQTLVIQQRGLDMSAIGMVSLAGIVMARTGFGFNSIVLAVIFTRLHRRDRRDHQWCAHLEGRDYAAGGDACRQRAADWLRTLVDR